MQENGTEVTAAGIARLAGVGRAAVSNWRRRHADFPKPVGGTETSPSFALTEVETWLRTQGKLAEVPLRERVWQQLAGHPEGPVTALVHVGCALLLVNDRPTVWLELSAGSDARLAELLPAPLDQVLTPRFGLVRKRAVDTPTAAQLRPSAPLLRGAVDLAAELGARKAYEFLLRRHLDANPRQYTLTPTGLAALMADLAGPARTVLDPACGTGALLRAVAAAQDTKGIEDQHLYGQDSAPELAALTALRLALHAEATVTTVRTAAADSLRDDTYDTLTADAVLCHPPFNERNWGHDELAYDPRWEYGFPARTESELAWVQHALARLKEGGIAVLLMPPAAASRRSGRRIRADLLRRGALCAVIALPPGAAPPYNLPLHLWVLRRPALTAHPAQPEVLLADTGAFTADGRGGLDWQSVRTAVLDAWRPFDRTGTAPEQPGLSRSVPVIELLDDDVDLAPARHLPPPRPAAAPSNSPTYGTASASPSAAPATSPRPSPTRARRPAGRSPRSANSRAGAHSSCVRAETAAARACASSPTTTSSPEQRPPERCPRATRNPSSPSPETSSSPCSVAVPSRAWSTRRPRAPPSAATSRCCGPTRPPSTRGSSPASCAAPPTTARPAATRPPRPASTPAASRCPGCHWTSSARTAKGSGRSPSSRRRYDSPGASASSWCAACTTA